MTQSELAKKLGISRNSVNFWEMSLSSPSVANIVEMAKLFHVTADFILSGSDKLLLDISELDEKSREIVCALVDHLKKN